ncbi:winged helix-turn-helix domain-containing protein [Actinopolymorpha sp. NPDC004070]|uniref:winged helix-turn-helix domain-containing protein n=1 Tax=Actinopolymorpha sp. NPDC004070 TaxID=3154548 RepID=UPI0033BE5EB3
MANWSGEPAYKQVAEGLRARIRDGRLKVGAQLPSIADLMHEYEVSITVVRMALSELRSEGLIDSHQGKGSFVRAEPSAETKTPPPSPEFAAIMQHLDQVHDDVRRLGDRLDHLEKFVQGEDKPAKRSRRPSS